MPPAQRRGAVALLGMMVLGTALETIGIGLVIPVLAFMSQSNPIAQGSGIGPRLAALGDLTHEQLLIATMLALVATYVIKTAFLAYLNWRQARFVFELQVHLSHQLFEGYLRQPYTFHLQRNSAQMIRNVVNETSQFSHVATIPALTLLAEGFVLLGISALLLAMATLGALVVMLTVGLASYAFHRVTRVRSLLWGEARQYHEGMRIQHLQQGLGGVKDVKLLGREAQFLAQYAIHNRGAAVVGQRQLVLQNLPRLWLELLGVVGLAALVLTMLGQGKPLNALIPTLGLFAAAAFRLMPSVNKLLTSIQSLRYAEPVIDTLVTELSHVPGAASGTGAALPLRRTLDVEAVSYTYEGAADPALRDIRLSIPHGASVGFVGGSGAGKSTLIDILLGILTPSQGVVRVDGEDIQANLRGWQNQIGYVPQHIYLVDDTLKSNVAFGLSSEQIDENAVWHAIRAAQLDEFVNQLPAGLETVVGERGVRLSGGQRQRIGIARALYHNPAVLVLDEATSALDAATERGVMDAVKALRGDKTILIVAHRTSTVEHCDTIVRLVHGRVAEIGDSRTILAGLVAAQADAVTDLVDTSSREESPHA